MSNKQNITKVIILMKIEVYVCGGNSMTEYGKLEIAVSFLPPSKEKLPDG